MSLLRQLKLEKLKRLQARAAKPKASNIREVLFSNQIEAISDPNPFVSFCTTRRAGKSTAKGAKALEIAEKYPGCEIPYIALTRDSTERIVWKVLKDFISKYNLPYKAIDSELKVKTDKGSTIFLIGADQKNFIERFRGAKFPIALIDEAGAFRQGILQSLVQDILEPCVADYQGQIIISGTPGPVPKGFFYEASKLKQHGFTSHYWSVVDNPYLPHINDQWLDDMLARKGQTRDNPTFRREWLGEWVEDLDALVYKYKRVRNDYAGEVPAGAISVLGVDYGFNDKTAFGIVSYHPNHRKIWVQHVEGQQGMIPSEIAIRIQQLIAKYRPGHIVADTGGLGKSITEEMRRRYGLPIQAAEKTDKWSWISLINGEFIDGNLLVHESCTEYKDQLLILAKDDKGNEDPTLPNDLCVAKGTLIETPLGWVPIESINVGDFVMTRFGPQEVYAVYKNGVKPVKKIYDLECTDNHPIFDQNVNDFILAKDCNSDTSFYWSKTWHQKQLIIKADHLEDTQIRQENIYAIIMQQLLKEKQYFFIGLFGKTILAQSLLSIISIIRMETLSIMKLKIWNVFQQKNILVNSTTPLSVLPDQSHNLTKLDTKLPIGINRKKDVLGTDSTLRKVFKQIWVKLKTYALSAMRDLKQVIKCEKHRFVATNATPKDEEIQELMTSKLNVNGVEKVLKKINITNPDFVRDHARLDGTINKEVFNLGVKNHPEYFANGILVHNCDAVLYSTRFIYNYVSRPIQMPTNDPIEKFKEQEKKWLEKEERPRSKEWWEEHE